MIPNPHYHTSDSAVRKRYMAHVEAIRRKRQEAKPVPEPTTTDKNEIIPYAWPEVASGVSIQEIICSVCDVLSLYRDEIYEKSRRPIVVRGRHIVWAVARHSPRNYSFKECGQVFGGFDHTTVMFGVHSIQDQIETNSEIRGQVDAIISRLNNPQ